MIPCKKNKCILYPVCISKRDIVCDALRTFYHYTVIRSSEFNCPDKNEASQTVWQSLKNFLPNLSTLKGKINVALYRK